MGLKKFRDSKIETRLLVDNNAVLRIDDSWTIYYGSDIEVFDGALLHVDGLGGSNIGCTIICGDKIHIGRAVIIGRNVTIRDNNGGHYIARRGYKNSRPVKIGQHAWLCEGCTITAGAKIGDSAIIGAKSLVTASIPPFAMVSGNPAQIVDEDVCWKF